MGLKGHKGTGQDALVRGATFVLMVSSDAQDVRLVADLMRAYQACALVTYESIEQLVQSVPKGCPALAIMAVDADRAGTDRALGWVRRCWPRVPSVVISEVADTQHEVVVRRAGALYVVRPVSQAEWLAILDIGLRRSEIATAKIRETI